MEILTALHRHIRRAGPRVALALIAGVFAYAAPGRAEEPSVEYKVKATYLYKFGAFVEWPQTAFESTTSPLNVCVTGQDPFGEILDKVADGQRIADRPIVVRHLKAVMKNSGCQILFVGGSREQSVSQALDIVSGTAVLTVTDVQSSGKSGVVHFVTDDNRVGFNIDEAAASREGLKISSKLLSLASSFRQKS